MFASPYPYLVLYHCRNRQGKIIKAAPFQTRATPGDVARVEPNKKWFGMLCLFSVLYNNLFQFS